MSIYKPCDIRGHADTELTPALYRSWGRALGRQVAAGERFVAGGDVRGSTPKFLEALLAGLGDAGAEATDLGRLPTPMIYFAKRHLGAAACAIVTASHNPAEINGLKWMIGDRPPTEADVAELARQCARPGPQPARHRQQRPRTLDVAADYRAWLSSSWADSGSLPAGFRVVLDPMYGCWAGRARWDLEEVFPDAQFSAIHDTPKHDFDGRSPDCSRAERLEELCRAVREQGGNLGIAFDGDGDRVAFVDDEAAPLAPEQATWIMLRSFGDELAGERFVYDLKFSDRIPGAARKLGAEPITERSGHAFIRARMLQTAAKFGAEVSGHYFFDVLEGGDDGLFAACRLIDYLARSGRTLAELRRACPAICMTPDLRLPLRRQDQDKVIGQVRAAWRQYPQSTIDGVRVDFPEGWALIRNSVTEPALTVRFEAPNRPGMDRLVRRFCDALPLLHSQLWSRYNAAMGDRR